MNIKVLTISVLMMTSILGSSFSFAETFRDQYGNKTGSVKDGVYRDKYGNKTGSIKNGIYRDKYGNKTGSVK